jgi:DNA-binding transcriptional LysR family regulator
MDSRFLETFIEVVRRGSIAAAARQLGLTSGAVAQRIQALEAEIGTDLLIRAGRTVQPTEAGRVVHDSGERVLREIRSMKGLALADGLTRELKLGAIATAMTGLMPSALRWLKAEAPNVEVSLLPGTSSALFQQLTDGEIDVALLVRPPFALAKEYE